MLGIARKRPGDNWNPAVGLAVALLKAEFGGPTGQDKNAFMIIPFTDEIEHLELSDAQTLVWADLRHGMRLALRAVDERRTKLMGHGFALYDESHQERIKDDITRLNPSVPSDGQLCETFAERFVSEADLQLP